MPKAWRVDGGDLQEQVYLGDSLGPVMFFSTWQDLEVMLAPSLSLSLLLIYV